MNNEIKEILEELKEKNETYKECSENGIIENECYKSHLLLDYITNLQTIEQQYSAILSENAELNNKITNLQEENERLNGDLIVLNDEFKTQTDYANIYKSRTDKALEYIKSNKWGKDYELSYCRTHLLNILQGEDKQ